jgi:hypothetical protein
VVHVPDLAGKLGADDTVGRNQAVAQRRLACGLCVEKDFARLGSVLFFEEKKKKKKKKPHIENAKTFIRSFLYFTNKHNPSHEIIKKYTQP